jgi:hypothetical protein
MCPKRAPTRNQLLTDMRWTGRTPPGQPWSIRRHFGHCQDSGGRFEFFAFLLSSVLSYIYKFFKKRDVQSTHDFCSENKKKCKPSLFFSVLVLFKLARRTLSGVLLGRLKWCSVAAAAQT